MHAIVDVVLSGEALYDSAKNVATNPDQVSSFMD